MPPPVLVTGASGKVGRRVLDRLVAAGHPVRASSRNPEKLDLPAETVALDIENPDTIDDALAGLRGVFLYARPKGIDGFAKAALRAGVEHIVMLSSSAVLEPGAESNPIAIVHRAAERALAESGVPYTVLHPWAFASNALGWADDIRAGSTVHTPYPDARIGAIHEDDIGAVAATVLIDDSRKGESLELSGPASISVREQVDTLAAVLGRPLTVHGLTPDEARARTVGPLMPAPVYDAILRAWSEAVHTPAPVLDTVEAITGKPSRTFHQWALDHREDFL